jgi:hypothetical protein
MQTVLTQSEIARAVAGYLKVFKGTCVMSVALELDMFSPDPERQIRAFVAEDPEQKTAPIALDKMTVTLEKKS